MILEAPRNIRSFIHSGRFKAFKNADCTATYIKDAWSGPSKVEHLL